ncbi:MAG TPA: hypothetical protein V6D23_19000 [Candidatus Obscuribacterales bacterium]
MNHLLRAFAAALACAPLLAGCASRQFATSFWKEHFVFVSARDGDNDVYLSDLQGRMVRQLTHDATDDAHPRITVDGRIVFASRRTGTWQIYLMDWDGSNVKALTKEPGINNYRPFPSPDGRIVFVSDRHLKPHIFSINPDGSDLERLTTGDVWNDYPVVAEDGHIYFTSSRGSKWDIWKMGPDGTRPLQLTRIPQNIEEIAVVSPGYPDYDTRFTNRSPMIPNYGFYTQPRIVFSAHTADGNLALYRVNEDGSELRQLSIKSLHTNRSPVLQSSGQVLFTSDRNGSTDIWTMFPDGLQPRQVVDNPAYDSTS